MIIMKDFIDRLNTYLRENNMSQSEFAKKLNCSNSYISLLLVGKRNPSSKFIENLSKLTDLSSEYWFYGNNHIKYEGLYKLDKLLDMLIDNNLIKSDSELNPEVMDMITNMIKIEIKDKLKNK